MKKQWKLDNKGMTLLEVIVAFAIFAIAATILITGFNGALKVMGNSEAIKDASQKNASGLESPLSAIEGVTVETLDGPGLNELSYKTESGGHDFRIKGKFVQATTKKTNDQAEMNMILFEAEKQTPPMPSPSVKPDGPVEINLPNREVAYYDDKTQYPYDTYVVNNTGVFNKSVFDTMAKKGSDDPKVKPFGQYFQALVVDKAPNYPAHATVQGPYEPVQQIYFTSKVPMTFSSNGGISYAVRLCYLGSKVSEDNIIEIKVTYDKEKPENIVKEQETNQLIFNSYEKKNNTILYLPNQLTIKAECNNSPDGVQVKKVVLNAGYYSLPGNTDLFETIYKESEKNKYFDSSQNGYYRPNITREELEDLGITIY